MDLGTPTKRFTVVPTRHPVLPTSEPPTRRFGPSSPEAPSQTPTEKPNVPSREKELEPVK